MNRFQFGVTTDALAPSEIKRRADIAAKHGAAFVYVGPVPVPGTRTRGWFEAAHRGEPFDRALARVVLEDVRGGDR